LIFQTDKDYNNQVNARVVKTADGNSYVDWRTTDIKASTVVPTDHNSLSGKQGGTVGEYYHLTSAELTELQNVDTTYIKLDQTTTQTIVNSVMSGKQVQIMDGTYAIKATGNTLLTGALTVTGTGTITIAVPTPVSNTNYLVIGNTFPAQLNFGIGRGIANDITNPSTFLNLGNSSIKEIAGTGLVFESGGSEIRMNDSVAPQTDNLFTLGNASRRWNALSVGTGISTFMGNVGIGTTIPSGKLDVFAGASTIYGTFDALTSGYACHTYKYNGFVFGYLGQGNGLVSGGSATDFGWRGENNLIFASGGNTERMRIAYTGNIGIGTTIPSTKLQITGSYTDRDLLKIHNTSASGHASVGFFNSSGSQVGGFGYGNSGVGGVATDAVYFYSNAKNLNFSKDITVSAAMSINGTTGNIGIGTTTPSTKLHVISTTEQLRIGYNASNYFNAVVGATGTTTMNIEGMTPTYIFQIGGVATWEMSYNGLESVIASKRATAVNLIANGQNIFR
jgi:hypothetical protein